MKWDEFENRHFGETCIVIGNGPGLSDIPLDFLQKYPSFGTNRIYLLEGFTPSYYVATNPLVLAQSISDIKNLECVKFVPLCWTGSLFGSLGFHVRGGRHFSKNGQHIHEGFTVTYVCLQLAYFMGFVRVLLVGVDHKYAFVGKPNEEHVLDGRDPNHFDPSYFTGCAWNNPDLRESEQSYELARLAYADAGREIINCSTRSQLEIYPRGGWMDYD